MEVDLEFLLKPNLRGALTTVERSTNLHLHDVCMFDRMRGTLILSYSKYVLALLLSSTTGDVANCQANNPACVRKSIDEP